MPTTPAFLPEWALYYPNPVWSHSNWLKNLVLFFDGIVLLAPEFTRDDPFENDSETAPRLRDAGLLEVVELRSFVDPKGAQIVAEASTDLLASRDSEFQSLAYSQLGYMTDGGLAELV